MDDRRVFARIDAKFPLRFLDPVNGREGNAETFDISANGIGFVSREDLSANTRLELWLDIPDQHEPLYTRGEVVWSQALSGTPQQRIGIHLEKAELMGLARVLWIKRRSQESG